jgi:hypothetical protein
MKIQMMKILIFALACLTHFASFAAEAQKDGANVVYSYKKYEKFDLGNLEIQGSVVTPGDLSVKQRSRKEFTRELLMRQNFLPEIQQDIHNLR